MRVTVLDAQGLPDQALLSIRVGEVRQQAQFRPGDGFRFDLKRVPWLFGVDVLEKVGSTQVWLTDLEPVGNEGCELQGNIEVPRPGSKPPIRLSAKVDVSGQHGPGLPRSTQSPAGRMPMRPQTAPAAATAVGNGHCRNEAASAKAYLDRHGLPAILQRMVQDVLAAQPLEPIGYMMRFLQELRRVKASMEGDDFAVPSVDAAVAAGPQVSPSTGPPGTAEGDIPGFPSGECPEELPDLSRHQLIAARVLREDRGLYDRLRCLRTAGGVSLASCIKPAVDNKGHPMNKAGGLVAGDAECYTLFGELFDRVAGTLVPGFSSATGATASPRPPPSLLVKPQVSSLDPSGKHVVQVQLTLGRNLVGMPFLPAMSRSHRRDAEDVLARALGSLEGQYAGTYLPIRGSHSFAGRPGGMTEEEEEQTRSCGALFAEPDTPLALAAGAARGWPDARGVFTSSPSAELVAWVNEEDHLKLQIRRSGSDLGGAFAALGPAEAALAARLWREPRLQELAAGNAPGACGGGRAQEPFAWSSRLGYLGPWPENVGSALRVEVFLRLPKLQDDAAGLRNACRALGLAPPRRTSPPEARAEQAWAVCSADRFAVSEVEQVRIVAEGVKQLVAAERRLANGEKSGLDAFGDAAD